MLTSIVSAVIILGLLILIHETGHFLVAKRCGVRVLRFSIGYPPKLFGVRRGETEYVIGAVPFGGYVRMLGDEIGDELNPADVATYLTEIGQDLVGAAGPQLNGDVSFDDKLMLIAQRTGPAGGANSGVSANSALAASPLIGRELKPEETLLLDEIRHRGSTAEAVKILSESAPPALKRRISERAFPSQPLHKRFMIVMAGPVANLLFAPIALVVVFMYGVPRLLPVLGQV
ncbi:MAG TPA: site-2 protease family protein, partial [Candidatus Binataceae bacterium]|nr:site-2 protease family protein [Candidatus Binataceae bacterium]